MGGGNASRETKLHCISLRWVSRTIGWERKAAAYQTYARCDYSKNILFEFDWTWRPSDGRQLREGKIRLGDFGA